MNKEPLVSIIVPAYNCADYIDETLSSIIAQDYSNIEIIVVNDGSKDNTLEVLKKYGENIVLIDQINTGAAAARNRGIEVAQGEFIGFCDADDLWARIKVREQINYLLDHDNVGMVYSDWYVWESDSQGEFIVPDGFYTQVFRQDVDFARSGWIYHKLLLSCLCLTSTTMFRKEIIEKVGLFDTGLKCGEDYNYWLRTSRITEIHKLKSQLVLYRILSLSLTRTPTKIHYEYKVLREAINRWGMDSPNGESISKASINHRLANMQFDFGYSHISSGDPNIAMKSFLGAILHKSSWYLPWAYLLLSISKKIISVCK